MGLDMYFYARNGDYKDFSKWDEADGEGDDLEDLVKDELSYLAGVDEESIRSFKYEVVEER